MRFASQVCAKLRTAIRPGEHLAKELKAIGMSAAALSRDINVPGGTSTLYSPTRKAGIPQYFDNRQVYGYLATSTETNVSSRTAFPEPHQDKDVGYRMTAPDLPRFFGPRLA